MGEPSAQHVRVSEDVEHHDPDDACDEAVVDRRKDRFSQHQPLAAEQSHRRCGSHDVVDGDHVAGRCTDGLQRHHHRRCQTDLLGGGELEPRQHQVGHRVRSGDERAERADHRSEGRVDVADGGTHPVGHRHRHARQRGVVRATGVDPGVDHDSNHRNREDQHEAGAEQRAARFADR